MARGQDFILLVIIVINCNADLPRIKNTIVQFVFSWYLV
jgi:hypothetical protein